MNRKILFLGLGILFLSIAGVSGVLLAQEGDTLVFNSPYLSIYSRFYTDIEAADPDFDGIYGNNDPCPNTPYGIYVINQYTKKAPAVLSFTDPAGKYRSDYDMLNPP